MKLNQDAKNMIAMMALVGAIAVALNAVVTIDGDRELVPWSIGLLTVAILFWIWSRRDALAGKRADAAEAAQEAARQAEALARRTTIKTPDAPVADVADDLTRINGIGAVYVKILNDSGIKTFAALAGKSAAELDAIIRAADKNPPGRLESWPEQAKLAAAGNWDGLRAYIDSV